MIEIRRRNAVKFFKTSCLLMLLTLLYACQQEQTHKKTAMLLPHKLPVPVSNNAVAYLQVDGRDQYYSFNGLLSGKTYLDITNRAHVWKNGQWIELEIPSSQKPVLASVAVSVKEDVYLFGGYTVAADHSEKSIPNVWRINGRTEYWDALPAMPTPVDDAVALVYQERYIYLISGWHDVDNVDLVQVFDTVENSWQQATPFPLPPVFGHAGGMYENKMLVCDGVKVIKNNDKKQFLPSPECVTGVITPNDVTEIDWQETLHHSGTAYYRMAAASINQSSKVYFLAGSDNPYNYNGIGYNTEPSLPSGEVRIYDFTTNQWIIKEEAIPASMDHRAALSTPKGLAILGGMLNDQSVSDQITFYEN